MFYSLVYVRSNRYHGKDPLTYQSESKLAVGSIVQVELQKELVTGVVSSSTTKPRFKTKPIARVYDIPPLPTHLIRTTQWMQIYYPAPLGMITQQLIPGNFIEKHLNETSSEEPCKDPIITSLPKLTKEQSAALVAMEKRDTYLIHGATGSGKTRLYIELAMRAYHDGKSSIILTPEISLTAQLAKSFKTVFGNQVITMHSQMTPAQRQKAWLHIARSTSPIIVIGPRSALFAPVEKLGLIVMDEAHEAAYKQEQAPQFQTGRVAAYLANLTRSTFVLGSATPSISDYFLALEKQKSIIRLKELAQSNQHHNSDVMVIDRKEHSLFNRSSHLSQPLLDAIQGALGRGEQTLLYLNRRGTARLVLCDNCGWQALCPHCDIPLIYHGDSHTLRCHSCDFKQPVPSGCPSCKQPDIVFKSVGTKAIVDEIHRLFPDARVARFDTDNSRSESFEQNFDAVLKGDVDILIGTQLLAKGLDLPKLSTLGILLADTSLYMPDFTAHERTFQLISQVLGRVGRGHISGVAIIQTYHPDHPILNAAIRGDYAEFYDSELSERKQFMFPPYCYLLKLSVRRATISAAEKAANALKQDLEKSALKLRIEGPAPAFHEKFQNKFQWQLIIKAIDRTQLTKVIEQLPPNWSYDIDPIDLL